MGGMGASLVESGGVSGGSLEPRFATLYRYVCLDL